MKLRILFLFSADSYARSLWRFPLHGCVILKRHSTHGSDHVDIYANQIPSKNFFSSALLCQLWNRVCWGDTTYVRRYLTREREANVYLTQRLYNPLCLSSRPFVLLSHPSSLHHSLLPPWQMLLVMILIFHVFSFSNPLAGLYVPSSCANMANSSLHLYASRLLGHSLDAEKLQGKRKKKGTDKKKNKNKQ